MLPKRLKAVSRQFLEISAMLNYNSILAQKDGFVGLSRPGRRFFQISPKVSPLFLCSQLKIYGHK